MSSENIGEIVENFFDDKISMNVYKSMFSLKQDVFGDYEHIKGQKDHDKLICMGNAIKDISKQCFKECVDIKLNGYPQKEQKCVRNCIDSQIKGILLLINKFERYQSKQLLPINETSTSPKNSESN